MKRTFCLAFFVVFGLLFQNKVYSQDGHPAPTLKSPTNRAMLQTTVVTFSWDEAADADYYAAGIAGLSAHQQIIGHAFPKRPAKS
jgi:hypothetical protein